MVVPRERTSSLLASIIAGNIALATTRVLVARKAKDNGKHMLPSLRNAEISSTQRHRARIETFAPCILRKVKRSKVPDENFSHEIEYSENNFNVFSHFFSIIFFINSDKTVETYHR